MYIRDPGTTVLGERIRRILLRSKDLIIPKSEMLLYMAARAQMVHEKIRPALKKKTIVICDRYADATVSYQGYGLGVDLKVIDEVNRFVTDSIMPDITFFLDLDIKSGLRRSNILKGFSDRIESRDLGFHRRVRGGYLRLSRTLADRIKRIPVKGKTREQTQEIIRRAVMQKIHAHDSNRRGL